VKHNAHPNYLLLLGLITAALITAVMSAAADEVRMELSIARGAPVTAGHEWLKTLSQLPVRDVRITTDGLREPTTEHAAGTCTVHGIITRDNRLMVLGKTFTKSDRAGLNQWIAELRAGPKVAGGDQAFGMSVDELVDFHASLAVSLDTATRGKPARDAVTAIHRRIPSSVRLTPSLRRRFSPDELVRDELQGLSCGTAMAAILRPLGLVFAPRRSGDEWDLQVTDSRDANESWPVGWPTQEKARVAAPKLLESIEVEINDVSLREAMDAIGDRLQIPLLFDHNGMARHGIDPNQIKVSHPAGRSVYKKLIRTLLFQAKLKSELRVDESDRSFLWISPIKK